MNRKLFISLSLASALLTLMNPCFAMEAEDTETHPITIKFEEFEEFEEVYQKSRILFKTTYNMDDSLEKATILANHAKLLELGMSIDFLTDKESATQLMAMALKTQGITLFNIAGKVDQKIYTQKKITQLNYNEGVAVLSYDMPLKERVDLLTQAEDAMRKSYRSYCTLSRSEAAEGARSTLDFLEKILYVLATITGPYASEKQDLWECIAITEKGIDAMKESYKLKRSVKKEILYKTHLMLGLSYSLHLYLDINSSNITIFAQDDNYQKYKNLIKNIEELDKISSFFKKHLLDIPIEICWDHEKERWLKEKQNTDQTQTIFAIPHAVLKTLPSIVDPETGIYLLWGTYCGTLTSASNTVSNLVGVNETITNHFKAKGQDHLAAAVKLYREKIYKDEYKNNPEKEEEFILARLESLAGNEKPLKEFYAKLRQERKEREKRAITQMIRDDQKFKEEQEKAKQKQKEEERKAAEERAAKQWALNAQKQSESSLSPESMVEAAHPSVKKESFEQEQRKKEKKKTRGEAHPPLVQTIEKAQKVTVIKPKELILSPNRYAVFQRLIDEIYDRNITLKSVLDLLEKGFLCKISNATGGGSHRKATAPNGYAWTIPPEWDGPIPTPYRDELMHFLLEYMGINAGLLEVKERG